MQSSFYSIPWRYVGQTLDVRISQVIVRFFVGAEPVKTHLRGKASQRQTDWNDYPPEKAAFFLRTPNWCREQASQLGSMYAPAVDELLDQHHLLGDTAGSVENALAEPRTAVCGICPTCC